MSTSPIDPQNIPQFTGDLEQLGIDTMLLTADALTLRQSGSDVHTRFQGLSACYSAPEAEQLFATTAPVATKSDEFADDLEQVAAALGTYEAEVQPLVAKLRSLKQRAETFRQEIAGDDDWREDEDNVQLNNDLIHDVNATTAAFWQAEITCHNKITALVGGSTLILEDGAEKRLLKKGTTTYGFTADMLNQSQELHWGSTVEKERHGLDWLGHQLLEFGKGFVVDGVWGTIRGLGTLVGVDGWDAAGEAWKGLGKLATGLVITAVPVVGIAYWTMPEDKLPSYLRDSRNTVKEAGKALVAWDQWGDNPARAGGAVTFNVLTTVFTGGAGAAAKGGAVARTVGALGRTARLVDPMTYLGKAAKFGTVKVSDLFANLRTVNAGAYADLASGAGRVQPDGTVVRVTDDTPVIHDNVVEWPDGTRLNLDDGTVVRADGTAAPAKVELSAADRELLERSLPHEEGALVGASERAGVHAVGDATARGGGHTPPTAHVGEHAGARGSDTVPAHDTGGHSSGRDGHAGGDAADGSRVPAQHGGTGGGDGRPGPTTSPAQSHGPDHLPEGRNPAEGQELSAAERKRIQDEHVWKANNDPDWRNEYYDALDRRKDASRIVDGVELPILARDADGNLAAKHDLPSGPSDVKFGRTPLGPDTAPPAHRPELDRLARDRKVAGDLTDAKKAYEDSPTDHTREAYKRAEEAYIRQLGDVPNNSKISEKLGEKAAELHVVPRQFSDAEWVPLPKTANGADMFDQVYKLGDDGSYLIVEAKAPSADLGWRKGAGSHEGMLVKQGTKEYLLTILEKMWARGGQDAKIANALEEALENRKLQYVLVKAQDNTGSYTGAVLEHFKIY
ncbi:hypothetical protein [Streptomyces sp. MMS20-AI2-20]|uniref:hypothetical protein n=1 Tax=Streptomyces sp. MMS20-AI2-20 TaxID=2925835 RepID=UPI001F607AE0|nr:hypothetical protein [Streptomyces sp. MMS20-AI2-20]MCI4143506.1 hypothetical protein [Streptomyces sp. MMS20-AI2-20]